MRMRAAPRPSAHRPGQVGRPRDRLELAAEQLDVRSGPLSLRLGVQLSGAEGRENEGSAFS